MTVLDTDQIGAFAWKTGDLYVTRGLVDLTDDEELAAAIAHEMGHLLVEDRGQQLTALQGSEAKLDEESRADVIALQLVSACGMADGAVIRLLTKVERGRDLPESSRAALRKRIAYLASRNTPATGS